MKNKKMKLIILITMVIGVTILLPNFCNAASTVSISFKDKNLYEAIINNNNLVDVVKSKKKKTLTVKFDKEELQNNRIFKEIDLDDVYSIKDLSGMEKFTNLETLYVGSKNLKDISAITKLKKLKSLSIKNYSKEIGNDLGKIQTLEELRIYSYEIDNIYGIKNLTNLKILSLDSSIIEDGFTSMQNIDIAGIKKLTKLTTLYISGNDIYNINEIGNLKKLKILGIDMSRQTDPKVVATLTNLTELDLVLHPQYFGEIYEGLDVNAILSNLTKLTRLSLVQDKILNNNIDIVKKLKNLTYIDISWTNITDLTPLSNLTKLERVEANGNNIKDVSALNNLKNLKYLYVDSICEGNFIPDTELKIKNKAQTTNSITLKWNKSYYGNGYVVYKYDVSKKKYVKIATTKNTSYKVTGLKAGTTYKFKIKAYRTVNKKNYYGSYSNVKKLTTATTKTKISKLTTGNKKVTIKWEKVSGASGYQIYMATSKEGKYSKIKTINEGKTVSYTKSKLKKNKKYYFKIRTYRVVDGKRIYSDYSSIKSIKVK